MAVDRRIDFTLKTSAFTAAKYLVSLTGYNLSLSLFVSFACIKKADTAGDVAIKVIRWPVTLTI